MPPHDTAVVSASVPLPFLPSAEALAAALRAPGDHPALGAHLERLLIELPPQIVLGFAHRQGIPMAVLHAAYQHTAQATRLRNVALEAALDGLA